jgi:hypothetical protein
VSEITQSRLCGSFQTLKGKETQGKGVTWIYKIERGRKMNAMGLTPAWFKSKLPFKKFPASLLILSRHCVAA